MDKITTKINNGTIPLTEFETTQAVPKRSDQINESTNESTNEKSLYTVIETENSGEKSSLTASTTSYKLHGLSKKEKYLTSQERTDNEDQSEEEELQNFKF